MTIRSTIFAIIVLLTSSMTLYSQLPAPPAPEPLGTEDTVLHIHVNSVLVPVVVRDAQGRAVGNLKQEDFKLFDQGKRRAIIGFTVQQAETHRDEQPAVQGSISESSKTANDSGAPPVAQLPRAANRFIVFLFDDRHLGPGNLESFRLVHTHGFDAEFWLPNQLSISSDQGAGPAEESHRYSDYHLFHSTSSIVQ